LNSSGGVALFGVVVPKTENDEPDHDEQHGQGHDLDHDEPPAPPSSCGGRCRCFSGDSAGTWFRCHGVTFPTRRRSGASTRRSCSDPSHRRNGESSERTGTRNDRSPGRTTTLTTTSPSTLEPCRRCTGSPTHPPPPRQGSRAGLRSPDHHPPKSPRHPRNHGGGGADSDDRCRCHHGLTPASNPNASTP
jgi:hypothetical protein